MSAMKTVGVCTIQLECMIESGRVALAGGLVSACCIPTSAWGWMILRASLLLTPRNTGTHRPWSLVCVCVCVKGEMDTL